MMSRHDNAQPTGYWYGRPVIVVGGCGFIGSHIVRALVRQGAEVRVLDNLSRGAVRRIHDVRHYIEFIHCDVKNRRPLQRACAAIDTVFNVAARVGGIQFLHRNHTRLLSENTTIQLELLEAAQLQRVRRFIFFSSAAVYPSDAPVPTPESYGLVGEPLSSWRGYAWSKRIGEMLAQFYRRESGMSVTSLRPFNVCGVGEYYHGPGLHVIPALIIKAFAAQKQLRVFGNGQQTRSFIDVEDLATLALTIAERGEHFSEINVSSPREVSIAELSTIILKATGRTSLELEFHHRGPSGATRSVPDLAQLRTVGEFYEFVPLEQSVSQMVREYQEKKCRRHS